MQDQPNFVSSPFDAIRHVDGDREFWMARELSKLLGYSQWKNFEQVIAKAKIACEFNGHAVNQEFHEMREHQRDRASQHHTLHGGTQGPRVYH